MRAISEVKVTIGHSTRTLEEFICLLQEHVSNSDICM